LYNYICNSFDNPTEILENSIKVCKLLFDKSKNTFIDSGYFFYGLIKDMLIDDEMTNAVVLIKFEEKTNIFNFFEDEKGISAREQSGYSLKKPHKICLVMNIDREDGFKILQVDPQNRLEAEYWIKDFLFLKPHLDKHLYTSEYLKLTLNFTKNSQSFNDNHSIEKADLKNKTKDYFTKNDHFSEDEFLDVAFSDKKLKSEFLNYKENYQIQNDKVLPDQFEISPVMVNKNARFLRSIIKLDKNFHIYVHGKRELIERGVESDGRKYYKIYYTEEN
jgi:hypothetical protein